MKISVFNSTLSCISKCIRFSSVVINKKIIIGLLTLIFLGACASPTAMLAPAYTLTSTGSIFQAGFSYGTNELITVQTGKTPIENLQDLEILKNNKNIQKKTLQSKDFYLLVKNKIEKTRKVLNLSNQ